MCCVVCASWGWAGWAGWAGATGTAQSLQRHIRRHGPLAFVCVTGIKPDNTLLYIARDGNGYCARDSNSYCA